MRALGQQQRRTIWLALPDDAGRYVVVGRALARGHHRTVGLGAVGGGSAQVLQRAQQAARALRRADRRAQFHDAFIARAGLAWGSRSYQCAGMLPEQLEHGGLVDGLVQIEQPGQHTLDVAVEQRLRLVVGDAQQCADGVLANPWKRQQCGPFGREDAAILGGDDLGRPVQVAGTSVIAEPLPCLEHILQVSRGQGIHRWKAFHPTVVIADDRLDARLLQHHFADPNRIRVARAGWRHPPGQVALVRVVPLHQQTSYSRVIARSPAYDRLGP